jgi:hypothetical protein
MREHSSFIFGRTPELFCLKKAENIVENTERNKVYCFSFFLDGSASSDTSKIFVGIVLLISSLCVTPVFDLLCSSGSA